LYNQYQQDHHWPSQTPAPATLQGSQLAILGTGSIGRHVAKVAKSFGMKVSGVSRTNTCTKTDFDIIYQDISLAVQDANYVLACLPDTPATRNIVGKTVFDAMKNDALFINVGRGSTVNTQELIQALEKNSISRAILDVFPNEPLDKNNPIWDFPRLTITPHIAATSSAQQVYQVFIENLSRFQNKEALHYQIDPENGY